MNNVAAIFSLLQLLERPNNTPFLSRTCELYSQPKNTCSHPLKSLQTSVKKPTQTCWLKGTTIMDGCD